MHLLRWTSRLRSKQALGVAGAGLAADAAAVAVTSPSHSS
eukprot:SAG31_NODE_26622_length_439_cov_0.911765_1_plen_39_part_01